MSQPPLQLLIVDDFAEDRDMIRRCLLKGLECRLLCHEAATGEAALQLYMEVQATAASFDILLLDLNLPDMNGLEILQELKGDHAILPLPVVVLTGAPRDEEARAALAAGAQDFIAKSQITAETLSRTVQNAIERFRLIKALQASEERSRRQLAELQAAEQAERAQRRLAEALLNSLTALTGSLDVESVMQQLLACAAMVVPSDAGSVILYEEGVGRVAYLRGFGPDAADFFKEYRFPLHNTTQGSNSIPTDPYLIVDTVHWPHWLSLPVTNWIRSSIRIPIELHGEFIGLLIADSAIPNHFQSADLEKLQAFARYASLALEKADYINKLETRVAMRTADLRASKERVEAILENSLDGILLVHTDLQIEQTNPAFHKLFAGEPELYQHQTLLELVQPAERERVAAVLQAVTIEQVGTQLETRMLRSDKTIFDAELSVGYINQTGLVCSLRDITRRKHAEEELRQSELLYRLLAENITDIVIRYNSKGEFTYISPSCRALLGYEPEELLGQSGLRYIADDDVPYFQQLNQVLLDNPHTVANVSGRFRHKDGHYLWLEFAGRIIRSVETGELVEAVVSARDITQRKLAEEALQQQRDFLQLVINSVPNFIAVKDRDGRFQLVNEEAAHLYGIARSAMIGKTAAELNSNPADVALIQQHDQRVLELDHAIVNHEMASLGRYFQTSRTPLRNADGQVDRILIVSFDITERKQAEAALQQALQKEKELGELKSRFISMASHEFRTPLAAIRATTDTLLTYRQRLPDEQIGRRLGKIQGQVDYLKGIIEDVLQLARLQARRVEYTPIQVDLEQLCRSLLEELQGQDERIERLHYEVDETLRNVTLDPKLMRQIITNLLSNALKYSPTHKPVELALTNYDGVLVLRVRDEGIGIPAADLPHLFQPFHRASNVGTIAGTGLGLTITKESVELQGGTLNVMSEVDVGTTFIVRIPLNGHHALDGNRE